VRGNKIKVQLRKYVLYASYFTEHLNLASKLVSAGVLAVCLFPRLSFFKNISHKGTIFAESAQNGSSTTAERAVLGQRSPEMTHVFDYLTMRHDRRWNDWENGLGARSKQFTFLDDIRAISAPSTRSNVIHPSLSPLFPNFFSLSIPLYLLTLLLILFAQISISRRLVEVSVPVAGFDGSTVLIEDRESRRFNLNSLSFCIIRFNQIVILFNFILHIDVFVKLRRCSFSIFIIIIIFGSRFDKYELSIIRRAFPPPEQAGGK